MAYNIRLIYLYDLITVVFNDILHSCYDWTGISVTFREPSIQFG